MGARSSIYPNWVNLPEIRLLKRPRPNYLRQVAGSPPRDLNLCGAHHRTHSLPCLHGAVSVRTLSSKFRGLTFINDLSRRNPASQLNGGVPPQSYGACPRPASPASTEFPELLPDFASYEPPQTQKPKDRRRRLICYWLLIVLLQVVLIVYRSNLAKFVSLELTAYRAAREGSELSAEREKSERERAKMRHDREVWGEVPDDRVPPGAYWKDIWPAYDCRAYGRREYWGVLLAKPEGWSAMDACMNTPAEVKGVTLRRPDRCAFVNGSPTIHGYWMVDWDQEDCKPWHKDIRDTVSQKLPLHPCSRTMLTCQRDARTVDPASLESRQKSKA